MKKVFHILEDPLDLIASGVNTVVKDLNYQLNKGNIQSNIISTSFCNSSGDYECQTLFKNGLWRYCTDLKPCVEKIISSDNPVFHTHGIWMYPQYIANKVAKEHNIPFIVTAHGMLEPWLFSKGGMKKKLYLKLFQQDNIKNASVLHAISSMEKDNLYSLIGHKNIVVIPNLISTKLFENVDVTDKVKDSKYILYLGRIHPKKGIDLLIKAFSKLPNNNIILKIAGPENEYQNQLLKLSEELGISDRTEFLGCISGDEKYSLYKNAEVFVAPSYSEVIGMVNLEAGLMSTPVITTYNTGILEGWSKNGGKLINPDWEELYNALLEFTSLSDLERDDRGARLKGFIIENYSWEKNIGKWKDLYNSL